ncbi:MAG: IgA Peptidase M64 [Prevotellaceae bacterium]|nr:IgA Peptidase M64 [Prevotellaceae bacterium]
MKTFLSTLCFTMVCMSAHCSLFGDFFTEGTLRVDYFYAGNSERTEIFLDELIREPHWGGPVSLPENRDDMGNARYNLYDSKTGKLLFSRGISVLFHEWKTTAESRTVSRTMSSTAVMPFPVSKVIFEIEERDWKTGLFSRIFLLEIDPADYFIRPELRVPCSWNKLTDRGDPASHVDIAFIAEGYTGEEIPKFYKDVSRISEYILSQSPFSEYRERFNIYAVAGISEESGTDVPGERIYRNTILNSSFYSFDIDRYLTTSDNKQIYNLAANVPCDFIFILVNSDRYGGGGFYNWYAMATSDNVVADMVAIHEFGHSFAGLADEYYTSEVAYSDFYSFDVEPWEANITTLVDFDSKWKDMLDKSLPVPTPREAKYSSATGVFEGGGYVAKGIYSPQQNCRMNSISEKFCPVCQRAIVKKIKYYSR